jgi:hypothetical protein
MYRKNILCAAALMGRSAVPDCAPTWAPMQATADKPAGGCCYACSCKVSLLPSMIHMHGGQACNSTPKAICMPNMSANHSHLLQLPLLQESTAQHSIAHKECSVKLCMYVVLPKGVMGIAELAPSGSRRASSVCEHPNMKRRTGQGCQASRWANMHSSEDQHRPPP